jgi:peptide/nickel transport system substrate-binding protein
MAMMISPAALDNEDLDLVPVGSGPYIYDEGASTPGDSYTFHANPDYWDPSIPRAETLELTVMTDAEARLNAVIAGQVDMAPGTVEQFAPAESAGLDVLTEQVGWIGFSLADRDGAQVPELADVRVRQAMNHAVDRDAILETVGLGLGETTTQIYPPGSPAITDEINEMYPYDPDRARELLAEAGYEDGFTIPVTTNARRQTYVEAVAGYLAEIGIELDIELIDAGFIETWLDGNHPMPNVIFGGRHPYEMTKLFLLEDSSFNPYHTADETVAQLFDEAVAAPDEDVMYEKFIAINEHVTEQAWFLVTHFEDIVYLVGPNVSGVETYPNQAVPSIYGWSAES